MSLPLCFEADGEGRLQQNVQFALDDTPVANVAPTLATQKRESEPGAGAGLWSHAATACASAFIFAMRVALLQRFHMPGYTV